MKIICFGDSNTWGYDPRSRFGDRYDKSWTEILASKTGWCVINEGINGREVPPEPITIPSDIDLFIVMLGTNDLLQLDSPEAAAHRMVTFLSETDPQKVILIAPPPMVWGEWVQDQDLIDDSVRLAMLYESLSACLGIRFLNAGNWNIPLSYDGVHFTESGQELFADHLLEELVSE